MRGEWEVYTRTGYTVAGAEAVTVVEHGRIKERAIKEAAVAAEKVASHAKSLGVGVKVEVWEQTWRVRELREADAKVVVDTLNVERADRDTLQSRFDRARASELEAAP